MKNVFLLLIVFASLNLKAQEFLSGSYEKCSKKFFNAKAEDQIKREFKKKQYRKQFHQYSDMIKQVDLNTFIYTGKQIQVFQSDYVYNILFSKGILYPQLISTPILINDKDSIMISGKNTYNFFKNDTLVFAFIEQFPFFRNSVKVKRFRSCLFRKGEENPKEIFFELTNKRATKSTFLFDFLNDAELTYFKEGSIITWQ